MGTKNDEEIVRILPEESNQANSKDAVIIPALMPKSALTKEAIRAREYVRGHVGTFVGQEPAALDALVMAPANPDLSVYREYRAGILTRDEMQEAIDSRICQDEKELAGFHYRMFPTKPAQLVKAEDDACAKLTPDEWSQAQRKVLEKMEEVDSEVRGWLASMSRIRIENRSNLFFLQELLKRQEKNPLYAMRIRAAINTHHETV